MLEEDSGEASGWEPRTRAALCSHPVLSLAFYFQRGKWGGGAVPPSEAGGGLEGTDT